ncbi:GIY-YIG nuclease family protein [Methylocapsa acidiphila]|uniref:GIY-YIG nuclease family protein n=1 Tax=Methylocapsa acidiphila TaxID=133552 RepID=UPI0012EBF285|nr:GIY-YIG nuclease family protein [Methylocapsa acidiphila]
MNEQLQDLRPTLVEELDFTTLQMLDAAGVRRALGNGKPFYVYILIRPDGTPFYVGKGVRLRVFDHEAEARNTKLLTHKLNLIRSLHSRGHSIGYRIDSFFDDETDALARERHLIASIGRHDLKAGPLTNQTDGGEGTSNPSEESRQRRRDSLWGNDAADPERQIANRYFQQLTPVRSVPIKPVNTFKRAAGLWKNDDTIGMKPRQAGALLASAIANRVLLEPGALLPRRLHIDNVEYIIENGAGRDMISNGMITLADNTTTREVLRLTDLGFRYVIAKFKVEILIDAGILLPNSSSYSDHPQTKLG